MNCFSAFDSGVRKTKKNFKIFESAASDYAFAEGYHCIAWYSSHVWICFTTALLAQQLSRNYRVLAK